MSFYLTLKRFLLSLQNRTYILFLFVRNTHLFNVLLPLKYFTDNWINTSFKEEEMFCNGPFRETAAIIHIDIGITKLYWFYNNVDCRKIEHPSYFTQGRVCICNSTIHIMLNWSEHKVKFQIYSSEYFEFKCCLKAIGWIPIS